LRALAFSVAEYVRAHRWARNSLCAAPMVVIFAVFVTSGLRGVDFGYHWDEGGAQITPVQEMVSTGFLFPHASGYPGLSKWVTLMPAVPAGIKAAIEKKGDPHLVQAAMLAVVNAPGFLLTVRRLYIVFSALTIVWVWAAALALRRSGWEAAVAAACIGLSWEFSYHSRFVAVDCLLVQFSAMTLFMLALYFREQRPLWLFFAAGAAGFATGAKYQGVILVLTVLLAGVLTLPARRVRDQVIRLAALSAVAVATFLLSTPETVIQPFANWEELVRIARYYETGHWGYTVSGPRQHLWLVLLYFSLSYFSPYMAVALVLFASAIVGAVFWVRSDHRLGAVLVFFPITFLLVFCFKYRVMIVRNYQLIGPFLALFAARGLFEIGGRLPGRWLRWSLAGAVGVAFVAGGVWLVAAGESIRHADNKDDVRQAIDYVGKHPGTRFRLSPQVTAIARQQHLALPPNALVAGSADEVVFFAEAEAPDPFHWKANDPWLTKAVFGPREINFAWCSTWQGPDRVIVMTTAKAKAAAAGISFIK
jgi:Dolichyl-phosphate-mannose-protein mannosyltransferase